MRPKNWHNSKRKSPPSEKELAFERLEMEADDLYWKAFESNPIAFVKWSVEKYTTLARELLRCGIDCCKEEKTEIETELIFCKAKNIHSVKNERKINELNEKLNIIADIETWNWETPELSEANYSNEIIKKIEKDNYEMRQNHGWDGKAQNKLWTLSRFFTPYFFSQHQKHEILQKRGSENIVYKTDFDYNFYFHYAYPSVNTKIKITSKEKFEETFISWNPLIEMAKKQYGSVETAFGKSISNKILNNEYISPQQLLFISKKLNILPENLYERTFEGVAIKIAAKRILKDGKEKIINKERPFLPLTCAKLCADIAASLGHEKNIWKFDDKATYFDWQPFVIAAKPGSDLQRILNTSPANLSLSSHAKGFLRKSKIKTVKELILLTEDEAKQKIGLGKETLNQIKIALNKWGLMFGMSEQNLEKIDIYKAQQRNSALNLSVDLLNLSKKTNNLLKDVHINTIAKLISTTEKDIKNSKGIGEKSIEEIKSKLKELKMQLGMFYDSIEITNCQNDEANALNLKQSIRTLNLPITIKKHLWRENITTIGMLVSITEEKLSSLKGFGKKTCSEIKKTLAEQKLSLGMIKRGIAYKSISNQKITPDSSTRALPLSEGTIDFLNQAHIKTIGNLLSITEMELRENKGFEENNLQEIKNSLKENNLELGMIINLAADYISKIFDTPEDLNKPSKRSSFYRKIESWEIDEGNIFPEKETCLFPKDSGYYRIYFPFPYAKQPLNDVH